MSELRGEHGGDSVEDTARADEAAAEAALLTVDELRVAIGAECPRADGDTETHHVEYTRSQFGDDNAWQDAECTCGISWREVMTVTFVSELDEDGDEIGPGAQVNKGEERDRLRDLLILAERSLASFESAEDTRWTSDDAATLSLVRTALREVRA